MDQRLEMTCLAVQSELACCAVGAGDLSAHARLHIAVCDECRADLAVYCATTVAPPEELPSPAVRERLMLAVRYAQILGRVRARDAQRQASQGRKISVRIH